MRMCEEVLKSQSHESDIYVTKFSLGTYRNPAEVKKV